MKPRRATEKDLKKCLRLMDKWAERIGRVGWGVAGEVCKCKKGKNIYAHLIMDDRAHMATLGLHSVGDIEKTALHEQLHMELAEMGQVVREMHTGGITERQRAKAVEWYEYYEDVFIDYMAGALLDMDKETRKWKRKAKKLEKQLSE